MTCINLLPWREMQRKERRRQFASVAFGASVLMAAIVFYVHLHVDGIIDSQEARNAYLQKQIKKVDAQIKEIENLASERKKLLARMNIIQQLQSNRPQVVHLFDELVKTLPDGVYLKKVKQDGHSLKIEGMAQSNARVSSFMRNLDASKWLNKPRLDVIKADSPKKGGDAGSEPRVSEFTLQVAQAGTDDKLHDKAEKSPHVKRGKKRHGKAARRGKRK